MNAVPSAPNQRKSTCENVSEGANNHPSLHNVNKGPIGSSSSSGSSGGSSGSNGGGSTSGTGGTSGGGHSI